MSLRLCWLLHLLNVSTDTEQAAEADVQPCESQPHAPCLVEVVRSLVVLCDIILSANGIRLSCCMPAACLYFYNDAATIAVLFP